MNNQITEKSKLYLVTRKDLSAGQQLAQTCHSLAQFSYDYPEDFREWVEKSNYIVVLSTENEESLKDIINQLKDNDLDHSVFVEPDLDNQVTALAISPKHTDWASRYLSSLPLAMKEYNIMSNQEDVTVT